jgi:hypothetical protein
MTAPEDPIVATSIRLSREDLATAGELLPRVGADPFCRALVGDGRITRSALLRLALHVGLEELSRRYPVKP